MPFFHFSPHFFVGLRLKLLLRLLFAFVATAAPTVAHTADEKQRAIVIDCWYNLPAPEAVEVMDVIVVIASGALLPPM